MNKFLQASKAAINRHGSTCSYIKVQAGTYDVSTGSVTNTETTLSLKAYKKHTKATQFSYPNLIGKDIALFYIAADSFVDFIPDCNDKITYGTGTYTVDSVQEHSALGSVVLYRILAIKG